MKKDSLGQYVLSELKKRYTVEAVNIGNDARLGKGMMRFAVERYEVQDVGNLCIVNMTAMLGLMTMETVVLACKTKDVPLINLDTVNAMGNKTQMVEFYDDRIEKGGTEMEEACKALKDADSGIPDYVSGEHWYSSILYPSSYAKKTKAKDGRTDVTCRKYFDEYLAEIGRAPECDPAEKEEKIRAFAQTLLDKGGPAVDSMRKMVGEEITKRRVLEHMYGVKA